MWAARLRLIVRWLVGGFIGVQAVTLAALVVIDNYRKKARPARPFPNSRSAPLEADGSSVRLYTYGKDVFDDMLAAIDAATEYVYLATYIFKDDRVGRRFKRALIAAADRGVRVCLVYDVFGNLVVDQKFFKHPAGVHVLRHTLLSGGRGLFHVRGAGLLHTKLLVVDGRSAFIGGYNIGALYATRWRDTHAQVRGEIVGELENAFVDYWNTARTRRLPVLEEPEQRSWSGAIRVTKNIPNVMVYPIRYSYLEAIDRGARNIWITQAYFIPDDDLLLGLIAAAQRGVDVRLIVPAASNHVIADWLSRGFYRQLLDSGVRLFLYRDAMVHAKTATVDGQWSTLGTANLDRLSLTGNHEINIEILDPDVAEEMQRIFALDLTNCDELTGPSWAGRSLVSKATETIISPLRPLL